MGRAVKQQQRKSADRARVHTLLRVFPGDYHRVARELGRDKRFVERWAKRADTGNKAGGGRKKLLGHRAVQRAVELASEGVKEFGAGAVAKRLCRDGYIQVIDNLIVPFGNACYPGESWTVLEDGASVHKAKVVVRHWATQHPHVHVLRTAPCSPDLNPIENCWGMLQSSRAGLPMNTMLQLRTSVHMDWQKLGQNQELMQRLFAGMPGRLQKTIDLQGGHIERNIYT